MFVNFPKLWLMNFHWDLLLQTGVAFSRKNLTFSLCKIELTQGTVMVTSRCWPCHTSLIIIKSASYIPKGPIPRRGHFKVTPPHKQHWVLLLSWHHEKSTYSVAYKSGIPDTHFSKKNSKTVKNWINHNLAVGSLMAFRWMEWHRCQCSYSTWVFCAIRLFMNF